MKLRKAWEITTIHGDVIITHPGCNTCAGTIRWANRHGYKIKRVFVLS